MLTHRRNKINLSLDKDFEHGLTTYVGKLCSGDHCIKPAAIELDDNIQMPQLATSQVFNFLSRLESEKLLYTGPDLIPNWVWKEYAAILTPVVKTLWNRSQSIQTWPLSKMEANINPLPKVDISVEAADLRGINVTPVIAREFERIV